MRQNIPLTRDIVLVGGGHTHALVLKSWGMTPLPGARLTLINPGPTAPYTGMLPGHVAGHYGRRELDIDLTRLARFAGARLILGKAEALDPVRRVISVSGRPDLPYDIASIDIGITSQLAEIEGFSEHAIAAKPLGHFAEQWRVFRECSGQPMVLLGGGVAGVELALAMRHAKGPSDPITVIDTENALMGVSPRARRKLLTELSAANITLRENTEVSKITKETVDLSTGATIPSGFTVGAAGARPYPWLSEIGLAHTNGFLNVNEALQSPTYPEIFAVGDCAHMLASPRPKAGVFAVRQAPILFHNLRAAAQDKPLRPFKPQRSYLKLISLGRASALAEKFALPLSGRPLWWLKDRIDRAFMERLGTLTPMPPPALEGDHAAGVEEALGSKPFCAGCGAKVGAGVLSTTLDTLPAIARTDVETGRGDDAAVLKMGEVRQVLTTDHLNAFTLDPYLFARITAHHALNDAFSMGAAPQAVLANITLPRMSDTLQSRSLSDIMAGLHEVIAKAGAEIVGGHTTMGAELSLGLSVTGLLSQKAITLDGAKPGDRIILSKPIGSGILLASEMALVADGPWVESCLTLMDQSQQAASEILRDAHAMTDVTGFGLAGHLMAMCKASGCGAMLRLEDIPLMEGAEALSEAGQQSTLYAANRAAVAEITLPETPRARLLFDPQTSGGMLAALPAAKADTALTALKKAGYTAADIGEITAGAPSIALK